jgi:hypothetical protein
MAEAQYPTLVDVASRMDANGDIAPIAEVLSKNNAILRHIGWQECNLTEGHKHSLRTGIPEPTWRGLYEGVQPTKSTTASVVDVTSNVEMYTDVDCDLADINGNTYQFRMSEQTASFQGMANSVATALYYGDNDKDIRKFTGLATRYNTLSKKVPCAKNCISAIDSSYVETPDGYTSIFIVNKDQFIGLYPKGSKYGLSHTDKGQVTVTAPDGKGNMEAYRDHYKWQPGAALMDWRGCVRVCNIPVKDGQIDLTSDSLVKTLIVAKNRIPSSLRKNLVMFMPTEVFTALEIAAYEKSTNALKIVEAAEQFKTHFFQIPMEADDAISLNETKVS